jgi:hypothetical protein
MSEKKRYHLVDVETLEILLSNSKGFEKAEYHKATIDLIGRIQKQFPVVEIQQWEWFSDPAYYDLWAVRPIGDKDFGSSKLFHVQTEHEAKALCDILTKLFNK